jgi:NAD(P)-dependent dehydrogenase (short-subunit alcohol dehydrogenase family)
MNDQDHMDSVRDQVVAHFGRIDILINNTLAETAGEERRALHEIPLDEYIACYTRSVNSVVKLTHYVAQDMDSRKSGVIVNVFTIRGLIAVAGQPVGVTSAASLVGMSKMWGVELLNSNIRVNGVAVGVLEEDPPLASGRDDAYRFSHAAIRRPCTDDEAAAAVLFLASDEASYITGVVLPVDGGISAGYARSF